MQTVRNSEELARARAALAGQVALVPTMGALHAGHMALIAEARKRADRVVASIFVNPLQFNDPSDLERYPRDEERDLAQLEAAGCDLVWLPAPADLYPAGFATSVRVAAISERWEGEHRPGHFEGVATGSVDDDDVALLGKAANRGGKAFLGLVLEHFIDSVRQARCEPAHRRVAVLEITSHRPLAAVQIERSDTVPGRGERNGGVHRSRRLARPALFVGEDDEMRLAHA